MRTHNVWYWGLGIFLWSCFGWNTPVMASGNADKRVTGEVSPAVRSEKAPARKKQKRTPSLWQRFKNGVASLIPESIKRGWRKTAKKWNQTVAVYRAVRNLMMGDKKTRQRAARVRHKRAVRRRWKQADRAIERQALRGLQLVLWRKACRAGSARSCQRWSKRYPKLNEPLLQLRDILRHRKQWKPLLLVCRVLYQRMPHVLENQLYMADALQAMGKRRDALTLYRNLSLRFSESGVVWLDWGRLLLQKKNWKQAQAACLRATQRMPRDPAAWRCLGDSQAKFQKKQARIAYEKACSLGDNRACHGVLHVLPRSRWSRWWAWSRIRSKLVGRAVARGSVRGSCSLGMGVACRSVARSYLRKAKKLQQYQRNSEALWWLRRATRFAPKQPKVWRALGLLLMTYRPSPEACQALRHSLRLKPRQFDLWLKLGSCYQLTARRGLQQARGAYLKACQPNTPGSGKPEACRKACELGVKSACYHRLSER